MADLSQQIAAVLGQADGPQSSAAIVRGLKAAEVTATKKEVNATLYKGPFARIGDPGAPLWVARDAVPPLDLDAAPGAPRFVHGILLPRLAFEAWPAGLEGQTVVMVGRAHPDVGVVPTVKRLVDLKVDTIRFADFGGEPMGRLLGPITPLLACSVDGLAMAGDTRAGFLEYQRALLADVAGVVVFGTDTPQAVHLVAFCEALGVPMFGPYVAEKEGPAPGPRSAR